jgi:hypothetical protein
LACVVRCAAKRINGDRDELFCARRQRMKTDWIKMRSDLHDDIAVMRYLLKRFARMD